MQVAVGQNRDVLRELHIGVDVGCRRVGDGHAVEHVLVEDSPSENALCQCEAAPVVEIGHLGKVGGHGDSGVAERGGRCDEVRQVVLSVCADR